MIATKISNVCPFCSLVLLATTAASTDARTAGTYEQRRDCRSDAMKFCGKFVPDVKRITECMEKNVNKLSPECRKQFK